MRLSTRGRYGLHAMYVLGCHYGEDPVSLAEISKKTGLSDNYLEQLIRQLKLAGLVDSMRGTHGGYYLTKDPKNITVGDILKNLEEFFGATECSVADGICSREGSCPARGVWANLVASMEETVESMTLDEVVAGKYVL